MLRLDDWRRAALAGTAQGYLRRKLGIGSGAEAQVWGYIWAHGDRCLTEPEPTRDGLLDCLAAIEDYAEAAPEVYEWEDFRAPFSAIDRAAGRIIGAAGEAWDRLAARR